MCGTRHTGNRSRAHALEAATKSEPDIRVRGDGSVTASVAWADPTPRETLLVTSAPARLRLVPLAAAVVLVVVPAFLVAARTPARASEPTVEAQVLSLTNAARTSHGLAPLHSSSALSSIARSW